MSRCECSERKEVRLTSEALQHSGEARLRCVNCGGKVGFIPVRKLFQHIDEPEPGSPVKITAEAGDSPMAFIE